MPQIPLQQLEEQSFGQLVFSPSSHWQTLFPQVGGQSAGQVVPFSSVPQTPLQQLDEQSFGQFVFSCSSHWQTWSPHVTGQSAGQVLPFSSVPHTPLQQLEEQSFGHLVFSCRSHWQMPFPHCGPLGSLTHVPPEHLAPAGHPQSWQQVLWVSVVSQEPFPQAEGHAPQSVGQD